MKKHKKPSMNSPFMQQFKIDCLTNIDEIMELIRYRHIGIEEGYDRIMRLLSNEQ